MLKNDKIIIDNSQFYIAVCYLLFAFISITLSTSISIDGKAIVSVGSLQKKKIKGTGSVKNKGKKEEEL